MFIYHAHVIAVGIEGSTNFQGRAREGSVVSRSCSRSEDWSGASVGRGSAGSCSAKVLRCGFVVKEVVVKGIFQVCVYIYICFPKQCGHTGGSYGNGKAAVLRSLFRAAVSG